MGLQFQGIQVIAVAKKTRKVAGKALLAGAGGLNDPIAPQSGSRVKAKWVGTMKP